MSTYYPPKSRWLLHMVVGFAIPLAVLLYLSGTGRLHLPGHAGGTAAVQSVTGGGGKAGPGVKGVPVAGAGEDAFMAAILADLRAPATRANITSLEAWYHREFPAWPPHSANNPFASTHHAPGATVFNTFTGSNGKTLHVWNYPDARAGAQADAWTIAYPGRYPRILAALRAGRGVCGTRQAADFRRWNGGGYSRVC